MSLFSTALGLLAVWGFVGSQQGFAAPQSLKPVTATVGTTSHTDSIVWQPPAEIAAKVRANDEVTGSIDVERGVMRTPAAIDAAAFEELRAEVSALRRAIEARESRPPGSTPTRGGVARSIQGVERRLAVVEGRRASRSSVPAASTPRP
jgi:hypothetical protein